MTLKNLILTLLFLSCSTLSQNNVEQETIRFMGGVYRDQQWSDSLPFKRVSWFHGLTLYYEALFYEVDARSKFFQWFAESEKTYINRCYPLIVSVVYSADPKKISHAHFRAEMENNGFQTVSITQFARSLRAHPHYEAWNLRHHRVLGFCREEDQEDRGRTLSVNFPSFIQEKIEL